MTKGRKRSDDSDFTEVRRFASQDEIDRAVAALNRRIEDVNSLQVAQVAYNSQRVANVESVIRNTVLEIFGPRSPEFGECKEYKIFYPELAFTTSRAMAERLTRDNQTRFIAELPETTEMLRGLVARLEEKRSDLSHSDVLPGRTSEPQLPNFAEPPRAFLSYSHDGPEHRTWVRALAARLRADGVETILDQWELVPGDQVPQFMERAVRENHFVLIICTPRYKDRSDARLGGVGYEGDIMTAEVYQEQHHRKFIPILRAGDWSTTAPTWLSGKLAIDLRGDPYSKQEYQRLLDAIHGTGETAPPVQRRRPEKASTPSESPKSAEGSVLNGDALQTRTAARDVLTEAIANLRRVLSAEATTLNYGIAEAAWKTQRAQVALLLHDDLDGFRQIADAYDSASRVSAHSQEWNPFKLSPTHLREAKDLLLRLAEDWLKTIEFLEQKALTSIERSKLDREVKDLKARLVSAKQILELDRRRG